MSSFVSVNQIEDQRLLEQVMRDQEIDDAIAAAPVQVQKGSESAVPDSDYGGVMYQRCGGGRRVIRKKIGGA